MTILIKLFAIYQEAYGVSEIKLDLPDRTKVSEVLDQMITQYPQLEQWRSVTRFGVNLQFVEGDWVLSDGDELVLIPPVSGG